MKTFNLTPPRFGFIMATRGALGAGLGLLFGSLIGKTRRKIVGMSLLGVGVLTTIPSVMMIARSAHTTPAAT